LDSTSKQVIDIQITQENVHDIKKAKEFLKYLQIKDMMHEISMILSKE